MFVGYLYNRNGKQSVITPIFIGNYNVIIGGYYNGTLKLFGRLCG